MIAGHQETASTIHPQTREMGRVMRKKDEGHVISASTILILSGFLIGLTVGKIVSESLSPYVLSCGLAGFLAFIALEFTGTQREEEEAHGEQVQVQSRLDRHVMSLSSMSFTMPDDSSIPNRCKTDLNQTAVHQQKLDEPHNQLMKIDASSDSQVLNHKNSS